MINNFNTEVYPLVYITGEDISKDQAFEIIRRTDLFFIQPERSVESVNLKKDLDMPINLDDLFYIAEHKLDKIKMFPDRDEYRKALSIWREKWEHLEINHFYNDIISSSAPICWCHLNGKIYFNNNIYINVDNFIDSVYNDWKIIANEFKFLKLKVICFRLGYKDLILEINKGEVNFINDKIVIPKMINKKDKNFFSNKKSIKKMIEISKEKEIGKFVNAVNLLA